VFIKKKEGDMSKLRTVVIFAMAVVLLVAFNAYGAKMTYNPDAISVTLEPGGEKDIVLDAVLKDAPIGFYSIEFLTEVSGDEELAGWVSSKPANASLVWDKDTGTSKASTVIKITVGEGASAGTYEGALKSTALSYGSPIDNGAGVPISVTVLSAGCAEAPVFVGDVSAGPKKIWARNKRDVEIEFSGTVTLPEGCETTVKYEVIDEYGEEGVGVKKTKLKVNAKNGGFGKTVTVPASRKGSDKDGRRYTIRVTAENEFGKATSEVYATVAHDQRKK
jgi:hypothetical protein